MQSGRDRKTNLEEQVATQDCLSLEQQDDYASDQMMPPQALKALSHHMIPQQRASLSSAELTHRQRTTSSDETWLYQSQLGLLTNWDTIDISVIDDYELMYPSKTLSATYILSDFQEANHLKNHLVLLKP